jgi:phosphopantothenoylcysteine decarboxylase/phosphopantothenate--cysteine ligase
MHFLITAGGTREYIDPVRFISNASSGKMGYCLAQAALSKGHKVTLISASDLQPPVGVEFVGVETAAQMFAAVKKYFPKCDCLIMAAAVSDYTPAKKSKIKIKKSKMDLVIKLNPTVDILKWAAAHKTGSRATSHGSRIVVGFALEDKNLKANAEKKLKEKNLDMIIANSPSSIGSDKTQLFIKPADRPWQKLKPATKQSAAKKIISLLDLKFQI